MGTQFYYLFAYSACKFSPALKMYNLPVIFFFENKFLGVILHIHTTC